MPCANRKTDREKNRVYRNDQAVTAQQIPSRQSHAYWPFARRCGVALSLQGSARFSFSLELNIDSMKSMVSSVCSDDGCVVHCPSGTKSMGRVSNGSVNIHSLASPITYAGCGKTELSA